MAAQGFIAYVNGRLKQVFAVLTSAGAGSANAIPALDSTGKLDISFLPTGIGANTVAANATEALAAGSFVNVWNNAGAFGVRLADNSNNREAVGYVTSAVASGAVATIYRLNTTNGNQSGLTIGATYWLGTAGGVISTPLDGSTGTGKTGQLLGYAKSATELVTVEADPVLL